MRTHSMQSLAAGTWLVLALASCTTSTNSANDACAAGDTCTCADGSSGAQVCRADGSFAACVCTAGTGSCAVPSEEYCDGLDNDCNGIVDDGEACPDSTVANTTPFYYQEIFSEFIRTRWLRILSYRRHLAA